MVGLATSQHYCARSLCSDLMVVLYVVVAHRGADSSSDGGVDMLSFLLGKVVSRRRQQKKMPGDQPWHAHVCPLKKSHLSVKTVAQMREIY